MNTMAHFAHETEKNLIICETIANELWLLAEWKRRRVAHSIRGDKSCERK